MATVIKAKTRITKNGFVGYCVIFEGSRRLWQESSGITRIDCIDAKDDAEQLKNNLLAQIA